MTGPGARRLRSSILNYTFNGVERAALVHIAVEMVGMVGVAILGTFRQRPHRGDSSCSAPRTHQTKTPSTPKQQNKKGPTSRGACIALAGRVENTSCRAACAATHKHNRSCTHYYNYITHPSSSASRVSPIHIQGTLQARREYARAEKAQCVFARIACSAMPAVAMRHLRPASGMEGTFDTSAAFEASHTGEGWTFLCD